MPDDPESDSLILELTALLHAAVILLRVAARNGINVGAIRSDLSQATTLLQRCVIRVARRTDVQAPEPTSDRSARRERLSPRERLIVAALAQDGSYKDIARNLDMSLSSVQARVKSIYAKLGVHSKAELRSALGAETGSRHDDG